ncbi:MAG: hypothetical protein DVB25_06770 [Verrucomicrobia bacterium]|nr:MAG: hypothetical protein DVB25_06770 [Verrucomicrobiota bacterium]
MISRIVKIGGLLAGILAPGVAFGCACSCGVFEVGTSAMFPSEAGATALLNYYFQNQNHNWSGSSSAPSEDNDDKKIETQSVSLGLQYMFDRSWGAQLEVPVVNRSFDTAANAASLNWTGMGDIRLKGIYAGFAADMSAGVTFGLKLPTGSYNHTEAEGDIDRDTQIGSGSTDLLLGGFYRHALATGSLWQWFAQTELDLPFLYQGAYRPGHEVDAAAGLVYRSWSCGRATIAPILQVIGSAREHDSGAAAAPGDTGYQRILLAPGIEVHLQSVKLYADVELPVYQHVNGNQVIAPVSCKVSLSYMF